MGRGRGGRAALAPKHDFQSLAQRLSLRLVLGRLLVGGAGVPEASGGLGFRARPALLRGLVPGQEFGGLELIDGLLVGFGVIGGFGGVGLCRLRLRPRYVLEESDAHRDGFRDLREFGFRGLGVLPVPASLVVRALCVIDLRHVRHQGDSHRDAFVGFRGLDRIKCVGGAVRVAERWE